MKICIHITLFIKNNKKEKLKEFSNIYKSFFSLSSQTQIFVHTNTKIKNFKKNLFFIYHDIKNENPYRLTWKYRSLMESQKNNFDYYIYSEDDTLFNKKNFKYWLKLKKDYDKKNYNVGFIRTERSPRDNSLWTTDQFVQLDEYVIINNKKHIVLKNPYFAMWIYDKREFSKFVRSKFWNLNKWRGLNSFTKLYDREKSAVGWHGLNMDRYVATIIPLKNNSIIKSSLIIHASNKYVSERGRIHVSVKNLIKKKLRRFKKKEYSKYQIFFRELKFFIYWNLRFNFKTIKRKIFNKSFL